MEIRDILAIAICAIPFVIAGLKALNKTKFFK